MLLYLMVQHPGLQGSCIRATCCIVATIGDKWRYSTPDVKVFENRVVQCNIMGFQQLSSLVKLRRI
ncbi:hypothetical protein TcasGA2_TC031730 [Tribolium castaneum]|uniref:Uncharacterized protein n=1 Tax=Tribolium castaneum TaxID=7070 RepID=A0A139W9H4_TRICA|nr:hypothetical protein TcasGA2_TC031730 [Tribolium castaneum]